MNEVLIPNGYVSIPQWNGHVMAIDHKVVATIMSNLAYYGYTIDADTTRALLSLTAGEAAGWWKDVRPVLAALTGDDRKMGDHIVYKNFPRETLEMDVSEQIVRQVLIYWGLPYEVLNEAEEARAPLGEMTRLKVLRKAGPETASKIFQDLSSMSNRWSDNQTKWATDLYVGQALDLDAFGFKENGLSLIAAQIFADSPPEVSITTATDVLRLSAALSNADVSLRAPVRFRNFKRAERRRLLAILDACRNIDEDAATRPEMFKRLFEHLRPGDYRFENVKKAYDNLYNKRVKTFSAKIDPQVPTIEMLDIAAQRPGEYLRRFHHFYNLFDSEAVMRLLPLLPKLKTRQLVTFRKYVLTINDRLTRIVAPKGQWNRAKVLENNKKTLRDTVVLTIDSAIGQELAKRLATAFPEGLEVDPKTREINLQTNDQKVAEYGRGTSFNIPEDVTFIRSASYWEHSAKSGYTWYDNGWNFFDTNWKSVGTCGWDNQNFAAGSAIMSGDPTNLKDDRGRACQMLDLYPEKLVNRGVRFAVWNILCYSRQKFSDAKEVLATLQWGAEAQAGKTYEPSRAQMVFPLKSEQYSSYVAYVDLYERKLVFMDAPLPANVHNTSANSPTLERLMPAYVEYLAAVPSLYDLVQDAPQGETAVLYSDRGVEELLDGRAYVFRPENTATTAERLSISDFVEVL